jgi:type IV pilus assembly protein PilW
MNRSISTFAVLRPRPAGFTLLEIMVALTLGMLLSIGILSLFSSTSRTNRLQNGLARLQENGRFATGRIESDLRMTAAQYCSNMAGAGTKGVTPVLPVRAPLIMAENLLLPDPGPGAGDASIGTLNSIDAAGYPTEAAATGTYALSPRYFVQGYSCEVAGTCVPAGLPTGLPAEGTDPGQRVAGSDVLTIRYERGSGWPFVASPAGACASGATLSLIPQTGDDTPNFEAGAQLALVTDCVSSSVVPVASFAGNVLTLGTLLSGATGACSNASGMRDMRVFNFSKDFVTVTYYLVLKEDEDPDARPNSPTAAKRVIPVLMRRENGVSQELVQGVDQLAFRYGVQDPTGKINFLTAAEVDAGAVTCTDPPDGGVVFEPGCLWRSVRTIEAHLLVNTVSEIMNLDEGSRQYRFLDDLHPTTDSTALPSELRAGSMLRREFIAHVSIRNYNF